MMFASYTHPHMTSRHLLPVVVEVPIRDPLHELLRRQGEEHAICRDSDYRRRVHDLLPVADAGHSSVDGQDDRRNTREDKQGELMF